jgi:hypothetical protein
VSATIGDEATELEGKYAAFRENDYLGTPHYHFHYPLSARYAFTHLYYALSPLTLDLRFFLAFILVNNENNILLGSENDRDECSNNTYF